MRHSQTLVIGVLKNEGTVARMRDLLRQLQLLAQQLLEQWPLDRLQHQTDWGQKEDDLWSGIWKNH